MKIKIALVVASLTRFNTALFPINNSTLFPIGNATSSFPLNNATSQFDFYFYLNDETASNDINVTNVTTLLPINNTVAW